MSVEASPFTRGAGVQAHERSPSVTGDSADSSTAEKGQQSTVETLATPEHPETDLDRGIVGWDGQDDPENPLNFAPARKWWLLTLITAVTFVSPLASSMFAPAVGYMGQEFGESNQMLLSFTVSVFLAGWMFGPLLLGPLSELYGRRIILTCSNVFFTIWQIGCALAPNIGSLIVFRFLAGIGGSACLALGSGLIADLFVVEQRGFATSVWNFGALLGPAVGPIAGGFIGQQLGWRWVFWILLIASAVTTVAIEIFNQETYARVLIRRKAARLATELGRDDLRSCYDLDRAPLRPGQVVRQGLARPFKIITRSPLVLLIALYMAMLYGMLYLLFTTISFVFVDVYGFSTQLSGLAYLGLGVGFLIGLTVNAWTSDATVVRLTRANGGRFEPEMRLPPSIVFACFIPISFFWYGWSVDRHAHWMVAIVGLLPFTFGMIGCFMTAVVYVIDCYPVYAASAAATLTATRALVGTFLPLAGPPLYAHLGLGWGNSLLGFFALAFVPIPILFTKYGKQFREKYPLVL